MSEPRPPGVVLRERAPAGLLTLRTAHADDTVRRTVAAVLGVALPTDPCTWRRQGRAALFWLAPDEWLATVPEASTAAMAQQLRAELHGHCAIVDVSGGYVVFTLAGEAALAVLGKSSTYDFHPRSFPPGRCVQTPFAKANALIAADEDGAFELFVRRSYSDYVRQWLVDAGREYALRMVEQ